MGAVDRLRSWVRKVRGNPWLAVGIVVALLIVCAWIAWAIHVWSDHGSRAGLGVLVAWPALLFAAALVVVPLVAIYLLVHRGESASADLGMGEPPAESEKSEATETG